MTALIFSPPIIAHRGASAYAPENTIAAFTKAIQLGAKWIECDVQLSCLDEVVVFHDKILDRTTNAHGLLKDFPFAYLQTLDAGAWFHSSFSQERIPSLEQTLAFLDDKGISLNIELKPESGREIELVDAVLKVTQNTEKQPIQLLYSSFCLKTLHYLREKNQKANIGLLIDKLSDNWQTVADSLTVSSINVSQRLLTKDLAQEVKQMKKLLTCYTVNDPVIAKRLYSFGVDAIFTDNPDLMMTI